MNPIPLILWIIALLPLASAAQTLQLGDNDPVSPHGYFELLIDPASALDPDSAMNSTRWRPLPAGLQLGFQRHTIWLRLTLQRDPATSPLWVLTLSNALLDDARLYQRSSAWTETADARAHSFWPDEGWQDRGAWRELRSGENLPRDLWAIDYRSPVFPLRLPAGEETTLLLRVQSKNALSVAFELIPRSEFGDLSRREAYAYGFYVGFCLLLAIFHVAFWRLTRAPESGWYLAYLVTILSAQMLTSGLPQLMLRLPVWLSDPLLGLSLTLGALPIGVIFASRQLQLQRFYPRLQRVLVSASIATAIIASVAILGGRYDIGSPLAQLASLLLIPLFSAIAILLWRRGHRPAKFFLFAFGIFYISVIISFIRNLGLLPATLLTDNITIAGTLLHMSIMSLRIIGHYNELKRDNIAAQLRVMEATRALNDDLEQQVVARTAELRAALDNETRIRQDQREFVALVSHEFRTPLAIIDTSAQQIARNPMLIEKTERRCRNIREATARLSALVDDYLTADRMEGVAALRLAPCRLAPLLQQVGSEWPAQRLTVRFTPEAATAEMLGDRGLLHVALRNLIANADRHATPDSVIDMSCAIADNTVCLRIANICAAAIPAEERARLFQKYYRGRQAQGRPGAGLGLYLVQRVARMHGGDVALIDAGENGRVCFEMQLPLTAVTTD